MDAVVAGMQRRIDLSAERPFELGRVAIDPISRDASFAGGKERLQPQNLKVLILLVQRRGQVVTRDELVEQCWDGRFVGEDVINRSISTLRQFAQRAGGFEIETVPRSGYRLIETQGVGERRRKWWVAIAVAAVLLTGVAGWSLQWMGGTAPEGSLPAVAILALAEDSPGRDVHELALAARASLSNAMADSGYPVALIDQRNSRRAPDLLVSGEVRRGNSSIQVFVQVEDTRHGVVVFSHRFEADERSAPGLPDQIGALVATNLSRVAALLALDRRHPSDPAIAAQLLNASSPPGDDGDELRAYELARQIAPKAPNSAIAQFTLASETGDVLGELPREQREAAVAAGRRAADRLLALAPEFGDGYGLRCALQSVFRLSGCEDRLRMGLSVDPDAPSVTSGLGTLLNAVGRTNEALQFDQIALAKDPLNPTALGRMMRVLEEEGQTADAERLFRQSIRWWPDQWAIYWNRLVGIESRGDYAELEHFASEVAGDKLPLNRDAAAKVIAGARAHDRDAVSRACRADGLRWTTQSLCMTALADLGDLDASFAIARKLFPPSRGRNAAEEERIWLDQPSAFSIVVLSSPAAASFRRDPRFLPLVDSFGLLDYWRSGRLPDFCTQRHESVCAAIVRAPSAIPRSAPAPSRR